MSNHANTITGYRTGPRGESQPIARIIDALIPQPVVAR